MSLFHHHSVRRQFIKRSFFFFGALANTGTAATKGSAKEPHLSRVKTQPVSPAAHRTSGAKPPGAGDSEPLMVFDAHLHCPSDESNQVWQWYPVTRTFAEFAEYLDRTGVQRGIINSIRCQLAKHAADFISGNREVARYVEMYKGRFLGACVVNPLFIDEALREIEDCRKQLGFVWVGELCNYTVPYQYTAREFELLVQQVDKLNMVLDVHTELEEMEYIIQKYPKATIVFPHFGDSHEYDHIFKRIDLVARH